MKSAYKVLVLVIILCLLLIAVMPGLAAVDKKGPKPKSFNIAGTVVVTDTTLGTVTVHVVLANRVAKAWIGKDLVIQTSTATAFWMKTPDGPVAIDLAALVAGDQVRVKGKFVPAVDTTPDMWNATRVVKGVPLPH